MGIIPLDDECFWCIVPYCDHVEICRQNVAVGFEECNWSRMTIQEKEMIINTLIQDAAKSYSDIPDISKRPISFEL